MEKKKWSEEDALEWVFSQEVTSDNPIYETWRRYRLVYWKRRKGDGVGLGSKAKEYILSQFGFEVVREYYRKP